MAAPSLAQRCVLPPDRSVPVAPTPRPDRSREPADLAGCCPLLDHRVVPPEPPPVPGEPQGVDRPGSGARTRPLRPVRPWGRATGTSPVWSGWVDRPYLPNRFGSTSMTRRASDAAVSDRAFGSMPSCSMVGPPQRGWLGTAPDQPDGETSCLDVGRDFIDIDAADSTARLANRPRQRRAAQRPGRGAEASGNPDPNARPAAAA